MGFSWEWILGSIGGIFSGAKAISIVSEGERGILLTLGKASRTSTGEVKVYGPSNFRLIIPFVQRIKKTHIRKNTMEITNLTVTFGDNISYHFNAFILYHVVNTPKDIEKVLIDLEDPKEFVSLNFSKAVQEAMYKYNDPYSPTFFEKVSKKIKEKVEKVLMDNGFEIEDCGISSFVETPVSQALRGVDYRIAKAIEFAGQLPNNILAAAIGATPIINAGDCGEPDIGYSHIDEEGNLKESSE